MNPPISPSGIRLIAHRTDVMKGQRRGGPSLSGVLRTERSPGRWITRLRERLRRRARTAGASGVEMQITITDCDLRGRWNEVPITFETYGIERHVLAPTNVQIDLVGPQPGCE